MDKPHKLLIVDDDVKLLGILSSKFEESGYITFTAKDGLEGLEIAFRDHPDLILLDLNMPRLDGRGLLKKLRDNPWGRIVPVIVLTNSASKKEPLNDIKDSIQGYFVKSEVNLEKIVLAVKALL